MTIWTDTPIRRGPFYLEDYESSLALTNQAREEGAFVTNPINSIMRMRELSRAERGIGPNILDYNLFGEQAPSTASEMQDAASARQKIKDEGLSLTVPDEGIRSRALDILIERKKDERRRNDIISRGPGGFVAGATGVGVNLAVSAMDPLNIASAFIPVVGEARYAAMLAKASGPLSRAWARAGVGALEGAAGAAAVEPLVYGAARQEQADYDLHDSIANIALGTVLGGGLHVGAGAIADTVRAGRDWRTARAAPDAPIPRMMEGVDAGTREAALRTGVAQAVSGREINVEPVVSYASRQGFQEPLRAVTQAGREVPSLDSLPPSTQERFREWFGESKITDAGGKPLVVYHGTKADFDQFDIKAFGASDEGLAGRGFYFTHDPHEASSHAINEQYGRGTSPNVIPAYVSLKNPFVIKQGVLPDGRKLAQTISAENGKAVRKMAEDGGHDGIVFASRNGEIRHVVAFDPGQIKSAFNTTFDPKTNTLLDALPPLRERGRISPQPQDLRTTAQASFAPEQMRLYDGEAVRITDERIAAAPKDEDMPDVTLTEAMEDVTRLAETLGDPEIVGREMAEVDALAETAAAYGRGVIAAADCRLRRS